jgi:hypothetical protein
LSGENFLDNFEIGQRLYKNPRGISCVKCHGTSGDGKTIVKNYIHKNKNKSIRTYSIKNISFDKFKSAFSKHKNRKITFMPRYNLTNKEIKKIYDFLNTGIEDE